MLSIVAMLLRKFREPSSWAGLSVLLAMAGVNITAEQFSAAVEVLAAIAGLAAIFIGERAESTGPEKLASGNSQGGNPGQGHFDA